MEHLFTVGRNFNKGKIAKCECINNDSIKAINVKDECFCLMFLASGQIKFSIKGNIFSATAPCFICFNEEEDPVIISAKKPKCHTIYFHPEFLNVNMTFDFLRSGKYEDVALNHDMFLMRPFLENKYIVPITEDFFEKIKLSFDLLSEELNLQRDWYWSCRSRSYFIEIIIALERLYGLKCYNFLSSDRQSFYDSYLENAVLYIEAHYMEQITLPMLVQVTGINHTTLTKLFKTYTSSTPMEYVTSHRISVAKKLLAFTEVPIKDISMRCGYKTVQHFSKKFKETTSMTPNAYRVEKIAKRKNEIRR
ncbi:MAG: helix-turn-helix domain-containing protein [Ruminococcaceae bacterium]|nr:helix-turn-helix domain-containing protein [Oscillospiraceae bacterium]